jgi:hypothetical protein
LNGNGFQDYPDCRTNTNSNMSDHTGTQHALRRSACIPSRAGT